VKCLTGANADFAPMVKVRAHQCKAFGWDECTYDLGGLNRGKAWPVDEFTGYHYKPRMILDALARYPGEDVLYLDADAIPVDSLADVWQRDFDIAVGVRTGSELFSKDDADQRFIGWVNAGVMFIRNNAASMGFVEQWANETVKSDDQTALNSLLGRPARPWQWWQTFESNGARVLSLPSPVFNYTHDVLLQPPGVRVFHFVGKRWRQHLNAIYKLTGVADDNADIAKASAAVSRIGCYCRPQT
jgi:hypothetical protein